MEPQRHSALGNDCASFVMISGNDILARLKAIYQNRNEPERLRALARLYWHSMLLIMFSALVAIAIYGAYALSQTFEIVGEQGSDGKTAPQTFTHAQLSEVLIGFAARQSNFDALKKTGPQIADPSH